MRHCAGDCVAGTPPVSRQPVRVSLYFFCTNLSILLHKCDT